MCILTTGSCFYELNIGIENGNEMQSLFFLQISRDQERVLYSTSKVVMV